MNEKKPLTALEWLRVTHADTLSGRRIEEAIAAALAEARAPYDRLAAEAEQLRAAHDLMAAQFRIMQREKEHGWREAERWEDRYDRLTADLRALAEEMGRDAFAYRDVGPANNLDPESCALIAEDAAARLRNVVAAAEVSR